MTYGATCFRFLAALLLLLLFEVSTVVLAVDISNLPPCSFTCILESVETTICSSTDYSCICRALPQFQNSMISCLLSACDSTDLKAAETVLEGICSGAGVVVSLPISATGHPTALPSATGTALLGLPTGYQTTGSLTTATIPSSISSSIPSATNFSFAAGTGNSSSTTSSGLSDAAKVGLGLGIPLGVALIGGIIWLVWRLHQQKLQHIKALEAAMAERGSQRPHPMPWPIRKWTGGSSSVSGSDVDPRALQEALAYAHPLDEEEARLTGVRGEAMELPAHPAPPHLARRASVTSPIPPPVPLPR